MGFSPRAAEDLVVFLRLEVASLSRFLSRGFLTLCRDAEACDGFDWGPFRQLADREMSLTQGGKWWAYAACAMWDIELIGGEWNPKPQEAGL